VKPRPLLGLSLTSSKVFSDWECCSNIQTASVYMCGCVYMRNNRLWSCCVSLAKGHVWDLSVREALAFITCNFKPRRAEYTHIIAMMKLMLPKHIAVQCRNSLKYVHIEYEMIGLVISTHAPDMLNHICTSKKYCWFNLKN